MQINMFKDAFPAAAVSGKSGCPSMAAGGQ